jgi:hypothetical protein
MGRMQRWQLTALRADPCLGAVRLMTRLASQFDTAYITRTFKTGVRIDIKAWYRRNFKLENGSLNYSLQKTVIYGSILNPQYFSIDIS